MTEQPRVMRPRHRHSIQDTHGTRRPIYLHLHTFGLPTLSTVLMIKDNDTEEALAITLDREGRDRLIRELQAANYYQDYLTIHPNATELT